LIRFDNDALATIHKSFPRFGFDWCLERLFGRALEWCRSYIRVGALPFGAFLCLSHSIGALKTVLALRIPQWFVSEEFDHVIVVRITLSIALVEVREPPNAAR